MECNVNVSKRFAPYVTDWNYEQYLAIGGYGSGKSHNTALKIILKLMQQKRTALVVRNVYDTIKESCFVLFKDILQDMDILSDATTNKRTVFDGKVIAVQSPMEIRFPNGSRIIFKGLDKTEKIKSIHGVSIVWIEECSEIRYEAYQELLGRIRTPRVTLHFILTCNPVGRENWVYRHFFSRLDEGGKEIVVQDEKEFYKRRTLINRKVNRNGIYYHHSTVDDNPFVSKSYKERLDSLKEVDKALWVVARYGRFGTSGLKVLPNFAVATDRKQFKEKVNSIPARMHFFGLDFGFEESYNALISCCIDEKENVLYIYDEVYQNKITDDLFIKKDSVLKVKKRAENCGKYIGADSAEPKTIQYYRQNDFPIVKCKKYPGSRLQNTKKVKRFRKIICSPKCKNTIRELSNLVYAKDSQGNLIYDEFNIDPHTFSAIWYALDKYTVPDLKDYKPNTKAS